jgi:AcrR family transcriptional regulator
MGLLTYYFGSKEGLLDAVVARRVDSLLERINQAINSTTGPDHALQLFLQESATYLASESPPFLIVAVRESLGSESTPIAEMVMARLYPHRDLLARILEAGIRNGTFHAVDSTVFYAIAMGALAATGGWPALHAAGAAGQAIDVLLRGIRRVSNAPASHGTEPGSYEPERPVIVDEDPFEIGMID